MDKLQTVITRFWQQQESYTYYVVGISVAAIGFVIVNTKGEPFHWSLIPAGLSVISWAISIFCGLRFIQYTTSTLFTNAGLLEVQQGVHPLTGWNLKKIEIAETELRKIIKQNEKSVKQLGTGLNFFFYSGVVLYLIGHLIEMYSNTF